MTKLKILWTYRVNADTFSHVTTWREMYFALKKDYDIHFIMPYSEKEVSFTNQITYVGQVQTPGLKLLLYHFKLLFYYLKALHKFKPDIIILDHYSFYFNLFHLFYTKKYCTILDYRTPVHNDRNSSIYKYIMLYWTKLSLFWNKFFHSGLTLINNYHKETFDSISINGLNRNVHIWPSGANCEVFKQQKYLHVKQHDTFTTFFHGCFTHNRGLLELCMAFKIAKDNKDDIKLVLYGEGPYYSTIESYVNDNELKDFITLNKPISNAEIPLQIAKAHLCALAYPQDPYWEANVPLKVLEYMALGKPLLLASLQTLKTITKESNACYFIKSNEPRCLYDAISNIRSNYAYYASDVNNLVQIVNQDYSWNVIANNFSSYLMNLQTVKI